MDEALRISISTFLTTAPYYFIYCLPFMDHLRSSKKALLMMISICSLLYGLLLFNLIWMIPDWQNYLICFYIVSYLVLFIVYLSAFHIPAVRLIYIFLFLQSYSCMIKHICKYAAIVLFPEARYIVASIPQTCFIIAAFIVTFPGLIYFLKKHIKDAFEEQPQKNIIVLCLIGFFFLAINYLYTYIYHDSIYSSFLNFLMLFLIMVTGLSTYFLSVIILKCSAAHTQLQANLQHIEKRLSLQIQSYRLLTEKIENIRKARHDLRHHLHVMNAYVKNGQHEELAHYLMEYSESMPPDSGFIYCRNSAVNSVISYYLEQAVNAGTFLDIRIDITENMTIQDSDLCIIFGNIFENAAKSCLRQEDGRKFIRCRCETIDNKIVLTVDNSVPETERCSAKDERKPSGIGLSSITAVTKKYGGYTHFSCLDGVFSSSVVLYTNHLPNQSS